MDLIQENINHAMMRNSHPTAIETHTYDTNKSGGIHNY